MDEQTSEWITDVLIRHSPKELGPAYLFVAEHWEIVQTTLLSLLIFLFLALLSLAVTMWDGTH